MRLSDAELRRRGKNLIYPNHRPPPWPIEAASTRDRSSRWLDVAHRYVSTPRNLKSREKHKPKLRRWQSATLFRTIIQIRPPALTYQRRKGPRSLNRALPPI